MWKEHSSNSGETAALQKEDCRKGTTFPSISTVEVLHVQSLFLALYLGVKYLVLVTSSEAKLTHFHPSCQRQTDADL